MRRKKGIRNEGISFRVRYVPHVQCHLGVVVPQHWFFSLGNRHLFLLVRRKLSIYGFGEDFQLDPR